MHKGAAAVAQIRASGFLGLTGLMFALVSARADERSDRDACTTDAQTHRRRSPPQPRQRHTSPPSVIAGILFPGLPRRTSHFKEKRSQDLCQCGVHRARPPPRSHTGPFPRLLTSLGPSHDIGRTAVAAIAAARIGAKDRHMTERIPGFSTLAVHAGARPDPTTGARATPIYQTTSFVFDDVDHAASLFGLQAFGNIYTRIGNPTTAVLEERVAALEGGTAALAVASGHAAQVVVFHCLMQPGDEFVASRKLYGGSINQFNHAFKNFGWNVVWADPDDIAAFERAITPKTKAIFIEFDRQSRRRRHRHRGDRRRSRDAPACPDRRQHAGDALSVRPIDHGADIVVHSLTKYLGGHGNSMGGVIVDGGTFEWSGEQRYPMLCEPRPEYHGIVLHETFGNFAFAIACRVLGLRDHRPGDVAVQRFLILTGIETLPLRMQRHCDNTLGGRRMARRRIRRSPGSAIRDSPATAITTSPRNMPRRAPAPCSPSASRAATTPASSWCRTCKLFSHLANIGDTRSLIIHPASTTHRQLSDAQKVAGRRRAGRGAAVDRDRGQGGHHRRSGAGAGGSRGPILKPATSPPARGRYAGRAERGRSTGRDAKAACTIAAVSTSIAMA